MQYEPVSIYSYITPMACEEKKYEVSVPHRVRVSQNTTITFPEDLSVKKENYKFDNAAFKFTYKLKRTKANTIALEYNFNSKGYSVKNTEFSQVCSDLNSAVSELPLMMQFPKPRSKKKRR